MIGPNQSIILRFVSTEHGAAACSTTFRDDRSYLLRTSSGSLSMRTNIVGTNCACVTWYFPINASDCSGSKCSIVITVPPSRIVLME